MTPRRPPARGRDADDARTTIDDGRPATTEDHGPPPTAPGPGQRPSLRAAVRARTPGVVVVLAVTIAVLAAVAAGAGLLRGPETFTVETVRGGEAVLYGQGVYRYETLFVGALNRGTDVVTLALGIPLLLVTTWWARRGSVRGALLLPGAVGWFLYVYATMAVRAAFNPLFVVYVALFAASLYAFVVTLVDAWRLPVRARPGRASHAGERARCSCSAVSSCR